MERQKGIEIAEMRKHYAEGVTFHSPGSRGTSAPWVTLRYVPDTPKVLHKSEAWTVMPDCVTPSAYVLPCY